MKAVAFLVSAAASIALLGAVAIDNSSKPVSGTRVQAIDRVIGEGKFNAVYPIQQAESAVQRAQYVERIGKVVGLLSSRDLSDMPAELRAERARNLQRLLEYRDRGVFPKNYDHPGKFLPCFIDRDGAICAAGYLVERSGGRELAEAINREYKYATIHEMSSPALDRWIASSGFTKAEIATIQGPSEPMPAGDAKISKSRGNGRSRRAPVQRASIVQEPQPVVVTNEVMAISAEPAVIAIDQVEMIALPDTVQAPAAISARGMRSTENVTIR